MADQASNQSVDMNSEDTSANAIDLASLQHELQDLRSKVAALERQAKLEELDEDTDDELPEFVNAEDPDDPFGENWQDWQARRKVARAIIWKVDRMKQRQARNRLIPEVLDRKLVTERGVSPPPKPAFDPSSLRPTLNKVPWNEFKDSQIPAQGRAVIDVLIGEAEPNWERGRLSRHTGAAFSMPSNAPLSKNLDSGITALPERIRINSPLLISVLESQHGSYPPRDRGSIVLLRPFKVLRHRLQWFRERYEKLEQKALNTVPKPEERVRKSHQATTEQEPVVTKRETSTSSDEPIESEPLETDESLKYDMTDDVDFQLELQHMRVLMDFINDYVLRRDKYIESPECQKVTFADLWLLFKPGDEVFEAKATQAYRIYATQSPEHKAVAPWEDKTIPEPAFDPPNSGGPGPWYSSKHIGDDMPFRIWYVHIDSDGYNLGPVTNTLDIAPFKGEKLVAELPLVPLRFRTPMLKTALSKYGYTPDSPLSQLRKALIARGQEYVDMNRIHHAYYKGPAHRARGRVEGQVVVDIIQAYSMDRGDPPPPMPRFYYWARGGISPPPPGSSQVHCAHPCCADDIVWSDQVWDHWRNAEFRDSLIPMNRDNAPPIAAAERFIAEIMPAHEMKSIADDDYLIMSERVLGFMLQTRKWVELNLGYISTVDYHRGGDITSKASSVKVERTAFDELVLPPGHREVILSLVAQHFRDDESHEVDIFKGKGKGLILLLHGAPGVGKTSTAEGVAEAFKRPLLQITCGDLGSTAREVEEALARNFELASRWDCILLLDEADVFLASRSRADSGSDLNRNALVAVFLRVLEYYTGILFLTTNRIGDFDEAFASRVHVSLEYPQLTKPSTTSILKLNIRMIKKRFSESQRKIEIDEVDISASFLDYWRDNEKARLNGRQIRNACQTALALAEFEAQGGSHEAVLDPDAAVHLQASHFDTVLKAYLDFNKYLKDIYGVTQDERATEKGYRAPQNAALNTADVVQLTPQYGGSQPGSFPGQHLYQQRSQTGQLHQTPLTSQHVYQSQPQVQQGQQSYYMPAQQQGYAVPPQNVNTSLPYYPQHALRTDGQYLPAQHGLDQGGNDTSVGHDIQAQAQSYALAPDNQFPQPHMTGFRQPDGISEQQRLR